MKFPSFSLVVPLLLTSLAGAPAGAARRVAVLAPEARGSGAAKLSRATLARLLRLLSSDNIEVVSPPGRRQAAALRRCAATGAACRKATRPLRADLVLITQLVKRGKQVTAALRLLSVERARLAASTVVRSRAGAGSVPRIAEAAHALIAASAKGTRAEAAQPLERPVAAATRTQAVDDEHP